MDNQYDILIVEDEPVVNNSALKVLTMEDYTVDAVFDAETALVHLEKNIYKLIITDLMLPKVSGMELLKIIKDKNINVPVIMITGYATFKNAIQSFKEGIFDFIPKPFSIEELLSVVYRAKNFNDLIQSKKGNKFFDELDKKVLKAFHFLGNHSWANFQGDGSVKFGVGITFSNMVGEIKEIDFPEISQEITQGHIFAHIISKDGLEHRIWSPLSGTVIEFNKELNRNNELISTDPFTKGWLVRVMPADMENELANLSEEFRQFNLNLVS